MFFFSISAPRTSQDEWNEEKRMLSEEQRTMDEADLYGIAEIMEIEEVTQSCLCDLRERLTNHQQLEETMSSPTVSIHQAMERCPEYLQSEDFLLLFLRAERFDVELAYKRLLKYWETKIELFGDNAFHPLTMNDLSVDDISSLRLGGIYVLPNKDKAGRTLLFSDRGNWDFRPSHRKSFARAYWFTIHHALLNLETQRSGFVLIVSSTRPFSLSQFDRKMSNIIVGNTMHVLPIRLLAMHLIMESKVVDLFLPFVLWVMGKKARRKLIPHFGSRDMSIECLSSEFGISANCIPRGIGGMLDFGYGIWLENILPSQGVG